MRKRRHLDLAVEQNERLERVLHIRTETVVWGRYDAESVGDVLSALISTSKYVKNKNSSSNETDEDGDDKDDDDDDIPMNGWLLDRLQGR